MSLLITTKLKGKESIDVFYNKYTIQEKMKKSLVALLLLCIVALGGLFTLKYFTETEAPKDTESLKASNNMEREKKDSVKETDSKGVKDESMVTDYILSIKNEKKKALLLEYWTTPTDMISVSCSGEEEIAKVDAEIEASNNVDWDEMLNNIKELEKLSVEELEKVVEASREKAKDITTEVKE
ncbi:hypothetical protein [Anaerovorax odorimutans]|uniref:hypothetical protein n=1 Tax=Anaerovorax odorimutans TaxID=109327 RepID=UPI000487D253|nr:hypothetical protein [Anaerovorax odorimutans]